MLNDIDKFHKNAEYMAAGGKLYDRDAYNNYMRDEMDKFRENINYLNSERKPYELNNDDFFNHKYHDNTLENHFNKIMGGHF